MPAPFRVLFVCTGNICRSPLGERLLRLELSRRLGADAAHIEVESAGVRGLVGEPMDPDAAAALIALGGDPGEFSARLMDEELVRRADVILGASRRHRSTVVRLEPGAARRTFTIRELARLARTTDPAALPEGEPLERLRAAVEEAATNRGLVRAEERADDDVQDPYGGSTSVHRETAARIAEAMPDIAHLMAVAVRPEVATAERPEPRAAQPPSKKSGVIKRPDLRRSSSLPRRWWLVPAGLGGLLLLATAWLAWTGLGAKRELEAAQPQVAQVKRAVLAGDTARAEAALAELQQHTDSAHGKTSGPLWAASTYLPVLGDDAQAVRDVSAAVDDIARDVLPPLVQVGDAANPAKLRVAGDRIALQPLVRAEPKLRAGAEGSRAVQQQLAGIETASLAGPLQDAVIDARGQVGELVSLTDSAAKTAELLPPLLGADGPRRYFMAFQNLAEARGTGGLLGAYGILEADNGKVRLRHLGSNTELKPPKKMPVDLGPDFAQLYGTDPRLWLNANVSPHFPYAAKIWLASWQRQHGQRLDGVIATDPVAMGYLLEATGPARLPNGDLVTGDNAAELTMKTVYDRYPRADQNAVRDRYLQLVAAAVFEKVLSGDGDQQKLAEQLGKAAGERRLLVYSTEATEQRRLERTALAGAVPDTDAPYAGVVVNSAVVSKLDYYLRRSVSYVSTGCTTRGRNTRITATLTNTAPSTGLPEYVVLSNRGHSVKGDIRLGPDGSNFSLVDVLATRGSRLRAATLDGKPVSTAVGAEHGHPVFGIDVALRPGQTRTVVLELEEPPSRGPATVLEQPLVTPIRVIQGDFDC